MITQDGWLDWAVRVPGPPDKVHSAPNKGLGYVPHSAVGYYGGWAPRLFSQDRRPDGRYTAYAAASVHGWIAYDGSVTQHYPFTASCWASGSEYPNTHFVAFENEGGYDPQDEPLTPAQIETNVRIIRELAKWRKWAGFRRPSDASDTTANLYEHCECQRFGSAPTACPSHRIPWDQIMALLNGETAPQPSPTTPARGRTVLVHKDDGTSEQMDIDEYARGVLPYEMSTGWPMEALKAQAILAKSYSLAAGEVYTDTRSQVYGPLRYPDTDAAVEQVRGMYAGYNGQIVMPFYFGHCNGTTRSPSQAGWNPVADRPYLQGVSCSCGRTTYFGHGIGMCQRGAQAMAERGSTFDQILRHYYQGIEILGLGEQKAGNAPPANAQVYIVRSGDSLQTIAALFQLEWPAVFAANRNLITDPNRVQEGWQLVIPRAAAEEGVPELYVVQPGDTLFSLARKWGCAVSQIVSCNDIADERLIRVGQRLRRP
jgi:LysM repeat protein